MNMSYDAWLEKPYQDRYAKDDAYVDWCEERDLNPDDDHWDDFDVWQADVAEDAAISAWEYARENDY